MRVLLLIGILLVAGSAQAASVSVQLRGAGQPPLVFVKGTFLPSDDEQFRTKVENLSGAIVAFDSGGGNLLAGIKIGTLIRARNFASLVPSGAHCASACALAWLGGTLRLMGDGARVGFHAASHEQGGQRVESGAGNALVGAYLNQLGLRSEAIVYITRAAPGAMTWLTAADAARHGIVVSRHDAARSPVAPPLAATASASAGAEPARTVRTRHSVYTIAPDKSDNALCIHRNGAKLICPLGPRISFGKALQTRDYDIVPVFTACASPQCAESGTMLVIEQKDRQSVNGSLGEYCLECSERSSEVKYESNEVRFQLGLRAGHLISARFQNGVISIDRTRIDSTPR